MRHLDVTDHLPKGPRVLAPHQVQLRRHREQQRAQVHQGQVEEVDVGGCAHILVLYDDQAGGEVTQHTQHQEQAAGGVQFLTIWFFHNLIYLKVAGACISSSDLHGSKQFYRQSKIPIQCILLQNTLLGKRME